MHAYRSVKYLMQKKMKFTDAEKQHAMNLFLGLFIPDDHSAPIWEQMTDYYLHHNLAVGVVPTKK